MLWIPMQIPQEKVGCQAIRLVSHRWSENAAVLFMSSLLGNVLRVRPKPQVISCKQLEAVAGDPVAGRDPLLAPPPPLAYMFIQWRLRELRIEGSASCTTRPMPSAALPRPAHAAEKGGYGCYPRLSPPEPNPGVVTDDWILSQVVLAEAPPGNGARTDPSRRGCGPSKVGAFMDFAYPPLHGLSTGGPGCSSGSTSRSCSILVPYMGSV